MHHRHQHINKTGQLAFTLLELMVAMIILTVAMSIAFQAFSGTIRAWRRGSEVLDDIKHGDFAMTQLVSALRSTLYFYNPSKTYAFLVEKGSSSGFPSDSISFVTVNDAFLPPYSFFAEGPHRLRLFIDNLDGASGLYALATPANADPEEFEEEYEAEPLLVSQAIQGLEILFWKAEQEDWDDTWDKENAVPQRIMITLFVDSDVPGEEPITFSRIIEIPVYDSVKEKLTSPTTKKVAQ